MVGLVWLPGNISSLGRSPADLLQGPLQNTRLDCVEVRDARASRSLISTGGNVPDTSDLVYFRR